MIREPFFQEKAYVVSVLFKDYLGLDFTIESIDTGENETTVVLQNGGTLVLVDSFFSSISDETYLREKYLPTHVTTMPISQGQDLVVMFGEGIVEYKPDKVWCKIDLVASVFFMLSRWEEYVVRKRDSHGRFPATESLASRCGFLNRPIVNEYVEYIWLMLQHLGVKQRRKKRTFSILPTHDVDLPRLWWTFRGFLKYLIGDVVKRRSFTSAKWSVINYGKKLLGAKDPFDTFDFLMSTSEKYGLKSYFFFMSGGTSKYDNYYQIGHPHILSLLTEIDRRGHRIGFHPSYNAYNDINQFKKELEALETVSPQSIVCGRQHFLRFAAPDTWRVWEGSGMQWDSTLSYADQAGFRSGTCFPYRVFDILDRKVLSLIERPLIVMEGSLFTYQKSSREKAFVAVMDLVQKVRHYNGEFVLLWHNSAFNVPEWKDVQALYEQILEECSQ